MVPLFFFFSSSAYLVGRVAFSFRTKVQLTDFILFRDRDDVFEVLLLHLPLHVATTPEPTEARKAFEPDSHKLLAITERKTWLCSHLRRCLWSVEGSLYCRLHRWCQRCHEGKMRAAIGSFSYNVEVSW